MCAIAFAFALGSRLAGRSAKTYEEWSFFSIFINLGSFAHVFVQLKEYIFRIGWNDKNATCSCLPNFFSFILWSRLACRIAETYEKWSFLSFFGRCGPFPQYFGQVQLQIILYLIKIKRACSIFFGLDTFSLKIEGGREECSNLRKMVNSKYFWRLCRFPQVFWAC